MNLSFNECICPECKKVSYKKSLATTYELCPECLLLIKMKFAGVDFGKGEDKSVEIKINIGIVGAPRPNIAELIKQMENKRISFDSALNQTMRL